MATIIERQERTECGTLYAQQRFDTEDITPERRREYFQRIVYNWRLTVHWIDAETKQPVVDPLDCATVVFKRRCNDHMLLRTCFQACMPNARTELKKSSTERRVRLLFCAWARLLSIASDIMPYILASEAKAEGVMKDSHMKKLRQEINIADYITARTARLISAPKLRLELAQSYLLWNTGNVQPAHYDLLYDIAPPPPLHIQPTFQRNATIRGIALAIYKTRAWSDLPILGDAIEESGCEDAYVLNHCRDTSLRHTRGCWLLDYCMGR